MWLSSWLGRPPPGRKGSGQIALLARKGVPKPTVIDPKLANLINDLYRPGAKIGTGSTADAIRYELLTGLKVGGKSHIQKGQDYIKALQSWLTNNPNASPADRKAAQAVLDDLRNALSGR